MTISVQTIWETVKYARRFRESMRSTKQETDLEF